MSEGGRVKVAASPAAFRALIGSTLGPTPWLVVEQSRVDSFADATDDWQAVHCDPDAASRTVFGGTIAHGYLTLSLLSRFAGELYSVEGSEIVINYGLNRVRFPAPVRVGARIRATAEPTGMQERGEYLEVTMAYTVEIEGESRPAMTAETVVLVGLERNDNEETANV